MLSLRQLFKASMHIIISCGIVERKHATSDRGKEEVSPTQKEIGQTPSSFVRTLYTLESVAS